MFSGANGVFLENFPSYDVSIENRVKLRIILPHHFFDSLEPSEAFITRGRALTRAEW